jgi:hypothetical protein
MTVEGAGSIYLTFGMLCSMPFFFSYVYGRKLGMPVIANCFGVLIFSLVAAGDCGVLALAHNRRAVTLVGPMLAASCAGCYYFGRQLLKALPKTNIQERESHGNGAN